VAGFGLLSGVSPGGEIKDLSGGLSI
jgi:hypothetical protein